jgi:hypothetical protein
MMASSSADMVKIGSLLRREVIGWSPNYVIIHGISPFDPAGAPP